MGAKLDKVVGTVGRGLGTNVEGVLRQLWRGRDGKMGTPELLSLRTMVVGMLWLVFGVGPGTAFIGDMPKSR